MPSDLLWVIKFSSDSARTESHRAAEMGNSLRADLQKTGQWRHKLQANNKVHPTENKQRGFHTFFFFFIHTFCLTYAASII